MFITFLLNVEWRCINYILYWSKTFGHLYILNTVQTPPRYSSKPYRANNKDPDKHYISQDRRLVGSWLRQIHTLLSIIFRVLPRDINWGATYEYALSVEERVSKSFHFISPSKSLHFNIHYVAQPETKR